MPDFKTSLTQGAGITAFKPTAAPTITGQGSDVPAAAVAVMSRGPVGQPFRVTSDTFESICGLTLPMVDGVHAEGLRQIRDSLTGSSYLDLVRVVPSDAKFPVLDFVVDADSGDDEPVVVSSLAYGTDVTPDADAWLTIWPVNGAVSDDIKVKIANVVPAAKTFDISFIDISGSSEVQIGKTISASTDVSAVDDNGLSKYLPSILEYGGYEYQCAINPAADLTELGILEAAFVGGTGGTISGLVASDYISAWEMLDSADLGWQAGFAAGIYDAAVLNAAYAICESRLAEFRWDLPPWLDEQAAIAWLGTNSVPTGWMARAYHYPYSANDVTYQGKAVWGVSGIQTANKAKCVALPTGSAVVAGWMFVPAGQSRGQIGRGGVKPLFFKNKATPDELFNARINTTSQGIYMNDCLSTSPEDNDLKFEVTGAVLASMAYTLSAALNSLRFAPASQTGTALEDLANQITQDYLDSGSLVQPTSLEAPYEIKVTQPESDYWHVEIFLKVGGTTRRMAIQFRQSK